MSMFTIERNSVIDFNPSNIFYVFDLPALPDQT